MEEFIICCKVMWKMLFSFICCLPFIILVFVGVGFLFRYYTPFRRYVARELDLKLKEDIK